MSGIGDAALAGYVGSMCMVNTAEYLRHWLGKGAIAPPPSWTGEERRVGQADRRGHAHDRRWTNQAGRRYGLGGRRQGDR